MTPEEADFYEKFYIKQYDSTNQEKGYNILAGGKDCFSQIVPYNFQKGHKLSKTRKVICVQTNQVFRSVSDAINWCGSGHVIDCCKKNRDYAGTNPYTGEKVSWRYYDLEIDENLLLECKEKINNNIKPQGKPKKVLCINTGTIFNSLGEASMWYSGVLSNRSCIMRCCKGERKSAGKHPETGEKLIWKYIEEEV